MYDRNWKAAPWLKRTYDLYVLVVAVAIIMVGATKCTFDSSDGHVIRYLVIYESFPSIRDGDKACIFKQLTMLPHSFFSVHTFQAQASTKIRRKGERRGTKRENKRKNVEIC